MKTFIFLLLTLLLTYGLKAQNDSTYNFMVIGDMMCHSTQFIYASENCESYDFSPTYKFIKKYLESADFVIGNLETTLSGEKSGFSGYPKFNTPEQYVMDAKEAGLDMVVLANNHITDMGFEGLKNTISVLELNNISFSGASKLEKESKENIQTVGNLNFVVLSYTYGVNISINNLKNYVNIIDTLSIKRDIEKYRPEVDIIIVYFHFGNEYDLKPREREKNIVNKTYNFGADIIIGSHPHTLQPFEYLYNGKNNNIDKSFVIYSLGNFVSNQRWRYSDTGVVLSFSIIKTNSKKIKLNEVSFLPFWVYKGKFDGESEYIVVPTEDYFEDSKRFNFINREDSLKILQSKEDTFNIIFNNFNRFILN